MSELMIIAIILIAVIMVAILATEVHRYGIRILLDYIKDAFKCLLSFAGFVTAACVLIIAFYANISEMLRTTLSAESIEGIKTLARVVTGADSVFVAIQTVAVTSFMVSMVSCFALLIGGFTVYVYYAILRVTRATKVDDEVEATGSIRVAPKSFLVYSRYNS